MDAAKQALEIMVEQVTLESLEAARVAVDAHMAAEAAMSAAVKEERMYNALLVMKRAVVWQAEEAANNRNAGTDHLHDGPRMCHTSLPPFDRVSARCLLMDTGRMSDWMEWALSEVMR